MLQTSFAFLTPQTTAVIEVIRQAVLRGERVLACAASNIAVDNMVRPYPPVFSFHHVPGGSHDLIAAVMGWLVTVGFAWDLIRLRSSVWLPIAFEFAAWAIQLG